MSDEPSASQRTSLKPAGYFGDRFQHLQRYRSGSTYKYRMLEKYWGATNAFTASLIIRGRPDVFKVGDRLQDLNTSDVWSVNKIVKATDTYLTCSFITGDTEVDA